MSLFTYPPSQPNYKLYEYKLYEDAGVFYIESRASPLVDSITPWLVFVLQDDLRAEKWRYGRPNVNSIDTEDDDEELPKNWTPA